jgi:hypothetical protein
VNYQAIYQALVDKARNRELFGYFEKHHVVPKCLGGTNDASNIILLSAKEHFFAHKLLTRIYPKARGVWYALIAMGRLPGFKSKIFAYEREIAANMRKGFKFSMETKEKISKAKLGKSSRSTTRFTKNQRPWNSGLHGKLHHSYGKKRSEETKRRMSAAQKACGNVPPSRKGCSWTEEQKQKARFTKQARKLSQLFFDLNL